MMSEEQKMFLPETWIWEYLWQNGLQILSSQQEMKRKCIYSNFAAVFFKEHYHCGRGCGGSEAGGFQCDAETKTFCWQFYGPGE
jgi:hypothetical protein